GGAGGRYDRPGEGGRDRPGWAGGPGGPPGRCADVRGDRRPRRPDPAGGPRARPRRGAQRGAGRGNQPMLRLPRGSLHPGPEPVAGAASAIYVKARPLPPDKKGDLATGRPRPETARDHAKRARPLPRTRLPWLAADSGAPMRATREARHE